MWGYHDLGNKCQCVGTAVANPSSTAHGNIYALYMPIPLSCLQGQCSIRHGKYAVDFFFALPYFEGIVFASNWKCCQTPSPHVRGRLEQIQYSGVGQ
jgi:hypothetical protein